MTRLAHPWEHCAATPDKPAIIMADTGETLTYDQMMRHAGSAANMLARLGCRLGDCIALLSENSATYVEICWAAKNSGLYYACISTQLNLDDATYVVETCGARILITSSEFAAQGIDIARRVGPALQLIVYGAETAGALSYEALRDQAPETPMHDARRGASVLFSSGTTGRPKAVRAPIVDAAPQVPPVRHAALLQYFSLDRDTVFLNPGPFYHAAPLRLMMSVHREGGTVVAFRRFDALTLLQSIGKYQATHGFFVPTMLNRMLNLPPAVREGARLHSMRCAIHGAAPCPVHLKRAMLEWWGPVLFELYGGTEGCGQTFITPQEWLRKPGSVGMAAPGCKIRIVDEHDRMLGPNQTGLIYMGNGRRFEYYNDAAKTAEAHDADGLATMGDIGHLDEDGYLFLTDRRSHMIISGGVNIYPQEAEDVLSAHPAVADVAVIGIPHADYGEEVKAVVLLRQMPADASALAAELIAFCRATLSNYKCPRSVDFVDDLPRNEAGKLVKRLIKARYWP